MSGKGYIHYLIHLLSKNQFSGIVLINEKGKILYRGGTCYSNKLTTEKNNTQTIFELASCSKQFIGVGIALLHRENKIHRRYYAIHSRALKL